MWKRLLCLLPAVILAAPFCSWSGAASDRNEVVVTAKAAGKLSAELAAVKLTGGKLVGRTPGGKAVVQITGGGAALAESVAREGATISREKPKEVQPANRLIITYKQGAKPSEASLKAAGLRVTADHAYDGGGLLLVESTGGITAAHVTALANNEAVIHAEVDQIVSIPPMPKENPAPARGEGLKEAGGGAKEGASSQGGPATAAVPDDPLFEKLWGMRNIHAPAAWDKVRTSPVIVADIDTGADLNHEDLKANLVPGFNFINNTPDPQDDHGHGTHTAGTIGAVGNNGKGVVGVCWKVKVMPLKFLDQNGQGSLFNAITATDYARTHGARVMNNSWGGGGFSQALSDAITRANQAGILYVAAAGNSNSDDDANPFYPANYKIANIIAVAAIDIRDQKASFSSFGAHSVNIGAPGVDIVSTLPKTGPLSNPTGYGPLSGTSMATPHVSGAAALILGHPHHYNDKAPQLKNLLLTHARHIPALNGKCTTNGTLDIQFIATLP